jgi:hypothetical protein
MMVAYDRSAKHDVMLTTWWAEMNAAHEFDTTFMRSCKPLGAFLSYWRRSDITLVFAYDERGIWFAFWIEPLMSSACIGLWIRADRRCTRAALRAFRDVIGAAVRTYPSLITVTCQHVVYMQLCRLGFTPLGLVPGLWDGTDANVNILTRARWEHVWRRKERIERPVERPLEHQLEPDGDGREVPRSTVLAGA